MNDYFHLSYRQLVQLMITGTISLLVIFVVFGFLENKGQGTGYIYSEISVSSDFSGTPCKEIEYESFVTPDSAAVRDLAAGIQNVEQAYYIACNWLYVPETTLNGVADQWEKPQEFLQRSPLIESNPLPGQIAGDCEEQANTLVSLIRALGVASEDVRVALGVVSSGSVNLGHVWVQVYINNEWLNLDPSQGSKWNPITQSADIRHRLAFDYYSFHPYPVTQITAYYNDKYFTRTVSWEKGIPDSWKTQSQYSDVPREKDW